MARLGMWRRSAAAAALVVVSLHATACSSCCPPQLSFPDLPPCLSEATGGLALAIGARANQPAPVLPGEVQTLLRKVSYGGGKVTVVRVDGDPKSVGDATFRSSAQNEIKWTSDLQNFEQSLSTIISDLRAAKAEANPLEGIALASAAAGAGGTVVLLDSGLQTLPPLDFRRAGMIDSDPKELVDFLQTHKQLPKMEGQALVLAGIGNVAEPQQSLDTARRANLLEIWREIGTRAGARCVGALPNLVRGEGLTGVPAVGTVAIPAPPVPPTGCVPSVLPDAGSVKFRPDSSQFVDEAEAAKTLRTYTDRIVSQKLTVKLTGTTSSAGFGGKQTEGKLKLSRERAEAVRRVLVAQGVPEGDVTAAGAGMEFPGFVKDRDSNNVLVPELAARNRTVIVEFAGCK